MSDFVSITVRQIPKTLWQRVRSRAALRGVTVRKLVIEALWRFMDDEQ